MGKKVQFSYIALPFQSDDGQISEIFRPLIPIQLQYAHGKISKYFDALIDTGADMNLFPYAIGKLMGVNFKKSKKKQIIGIGGHIIDAFSCKVKLWLLNIPYETIVDFSEVQQTPLLGRAGFFDFFKTISFDENSKFIEIEYFDKK